MVLPGFKEKDEEEKYKDVQTQEDVVLFLKSKARTEMDNRLHSKAGRI